MRLMVQGRDAVSVVVGETVTRGGTGQAVFRASDGRVWVIDFNDDLTASSCGAQGVLRRG